MIQIDAVVDHIGGQYGGQTARKLGQLDSGCCGETGNLGFCHDTALSRGYELKDIFGVKRLRELHDQRACCVAGTYRLGSLFRYDETRYFGPAKRNEFCKALIIKSLDGQNEQSLTRGVDLNGPEGPQFGQCTADA